MNVIAINIEPQKHSSNKTRMMRYRFGFNGQEKSDEISGTGNHNTALFWEYDTRLGRRWNLDPKPQVSISDYAAFGNNPILYSDHLGDIFGIGKGDKQAKKDVQDLAKSKNQQYIKFADDGNVTLDFGNLSQKKVDKILKKDKGLSLINSLSTVKENYLYETTTKDSYKIRSTGEIITKEILPTDGVLEQISNYSTTPRNIDGGVGGVGAAPAQSGVDGYVRISPGDFPLIINTKYSDGTTSRTTLRGLRSSTVYHELMESFARTTLKMPYIREDGTGAHQYAKDKEGNSFGTSFPGTSSSYEPPK